MEEEIKSEFRKIGFELDDEEEILKKCLTFCINYKLKPSDLVSSWEVYYLNRQLSEPIVENAEMDGFLLHLQSEQREAIIKEEPSGLHIYSSKDVDMLLNGDDGDAKEDIPSTPTRDFQDPNPEMFDNTPRTNGRAYSSGKPSKLITPFGQRTQKFAVKFSINNAPETENGKMELDLENHEDDEVIKKVRSGQRCSLTVHGSKPEIGCRFMYDRIEDKFNALESRIRKHSVAYSSAQMYEEPVDPTVSSQKSIFTVGMICCDGEGHLNEKSTLLQSSVEHSGGQRIRLELQNLNQFSIFPGQIVGIEGNNPSGHCFIASKIVDSIHFADNADVNLQPTKKQALAKEIQSDDQTSRRAELSVIIASGPFTTTDNFFFEPLVELIAYAKKKSPQLLILLGPFIDSEHPQIEKGTVEMSFDEIFRFEVLKRLQDYVECMGSQAQVILVPSIRDANHDFVFPQPPFDIQPHDLKYQITSLTNPGIFDANEVTIGCCSVDILKHLSGEEISRTVKGGAPIDRMSRLVNHILGQRSFYPLYPPAEGIPLDSSLSSEALEISLMPNILIVPSDMKYFVKVLSVGGSKEGEEEKKCMCINPGRLSKGEGGGTFVELNYCANPDSSYASIIGI